MLQKERKSGRWQVEKLQFLKREQRGLRLRYAVIDLQPCDLQTAKFSCLLHHKGALIFQIKRPLFCRASREFFEPSPGPATQEERFQGWPMAKLTIFHTEKAQFYRKKME